VKADVNQLFGSLLFIKHTLHESATRLNLT